MSMLLRHAHCFTTRGSLRASSGIIHRSGQRNLLVLAASDDLEELQNEIRNANGGISINVNSPKQVSQAIFGRVQSTSRQNLQEAASSNLPTSSLASLVLRYRELQSSHKQRRNSSSAATVVEESEPVKDSSDSIKSLEATTSSPATFAEGSYEHSVDSMFGSKSKIHNYWKEQVRRVSKPSARSMVAQLNAPICPMGYDPLAVPNDPLRGTTEASTKSTAGKRGSLLAYVREEKARFPECVLVVRVGEFYESFGVDAVMLVEHCGLNAMAGKCRAGCPVRNIQATLDCLTSEGFKVAVYEEATDTDSSRGPGSKSRLKNRMLGQVVSSASPTYLYDLVLLGNSDMLATTQESRPYVGVISSAAGYTMVEISMEERSVKVSERLTPEAVSCRLTAYPPVDPLFYVGDGETRSLPFLPSSIASRMRIKTIPSSLVEAPSTGTSEVERAKRIIVRALIGMKENNEESKLTEADFTLASTKPQKQSEGIQTNPLYSETATQLGLMDERTIPPLVSSLLPVSAPAACRRFLRRWLLTPPPPSVSYAMASLVVNLKERGQALPPISVPPVGKVVALLRAGQANAHVYGDVLQALDSTLKTLVTYTWIEPLMTLLEFESGIAADPVSIKARCSEAVGIIEDVVSPLHHVAKSAELQDRVTEYGDLIPRAFFERNELSWRGRVRPDVCGESYQRVEASAKALSLAVASDFWMLKLQGLEEIVQEAKSTRSPIVQDIFNNLFAIKAVPDHANAEDYFHPRDRNGKILRNRYTTAAVQTALSEYVSACEDACSDVSSALTSLSQKLCDEGHLPAIVQAAHFNLIIATASQHASKANAQGWSMARVVDRDPNSEDISATFSSVWPYWMDKSAAVSNSFDLDGMFLLTAPNMSGKSTLMRATAAGALLSSCGLCAPLKSGSVIRRFDNIFVRGASSDVPSENLSAFGAEVLDIAALLRCCTEDSLVFVDELGRGTSPRDGTSIAAAVVETMSQNGMSGIFATHLHDIFNLPLLGSDRIRERQMSIATKDGKPMSTYLLEEGRCTDSLAMATASRFGFPDHVIERAYTFASALDSRQDINSKTQSARPAPLEYVQPCRSHSLEDAARIVSETNGFEGSPVFVPPGWDTPSSLEGSCCVYVLELADKDSNRFYVGETDSLSRRLRQHRSKGGAWSEASAMAFRMPDGKSQARHIESLLIRQLATSGFNMVSVADGRSIRSDASNRAD